MRTALTSTVFALLLIGCSSEKDVESSAPEASRTIEVTVTENGFEPESLEVKRGQPITLVVTRRTDETCVRDIVIADLGIKKELPLNQPVTISFVPEKAGEMRYACGMGMETGVIMVR